MGNFSKQPLQTLLDNLGKGYIGLHVEQGVPVLDRDLNLLNDLISSMVRRIVSRYIGDGVAAGVEGFAVQAIPADNDFRIVAGAPGGGICLVGGIEVFLGADMDYSDQAGMPVLTTPGPTQPDPRVDRIYLDVWIEEVDGAADGDLLNPDDVGIQTSVRERPEWRVRVAEGIPVPAPLPGHAHYPVARLTRPRNEAEIRADMITDDRRVIRSLAEVESRLALLETLVVLPAFDPPPNEFAPNLGGAGTNVTLSGKNFNIGTPRVFFGTTEAALVGAPTATTIVATVPGGISGPVKITVITSGGTAVTSDDFVILPSAPPAEPPVFAAPPDEFAPNLGGANTAVTLLGDHFDVPGLQVSFGAVGATIDSVNTAASPMAIVARVPAGVSGPVTIRITTNAGTVTSIDSFVVL